MPFGDNTIDIIFSSSTYGYLNDIRKGLKEAFRIIKPGGTLVVSVNNRSNLSFRVLTKVYSFLGCIPFPVSNLYRLNKMRSLLEDVGFNIDYQEPIVHIPPLLNMLFSFLDNSGSKFSSTLSRLLMKIIHKYSDSKLGVKCFTGWYILFKVDKPKD
jgi:SAM-dependent methyltransferase